MKTILSILVGGDEMVLFIPLTVFESRGLKRVTLPKVVANHLEISKADKLWMFIIGNTVCISKSKKDAKIFLDRIDTKDIYTI